MNDSLSKSVMIYFNDKYICPKEVQGGFDQSVNHEYSKKNYHKIHWSCPGPCRPLEWTITDTSKCIVIVCPKCGQTTHHDPTGSPSWGGSLYGGASSVMYSKKHSLNSFQKTKIYIGLFYKFSITATIVSLIIMLISNFLCGSVNAYFGSFLQSIASENMTNATTNWCH